MTVVLRIQICSLFRNPAKKEVVAADNLTREEPSERPWKDLQQGYLQRGRLTEVKVAQVVVLVNKMHL